jgi:hypothetical protein
VVPRHVRVKKYTGTVYLYVPHPSGDLLAGGFGDDYQRQLDDARSAPPAAVTNTMSGTHSGFSIQVGRLHGDVHNNR